MDTIIGVLGERGSVIAITVLGAALCAPGVGKVAAPGNWLSGPGILGSALGVLALVIAGTALTGNSLPLVPNERAALLAIAGIIVLKFGVAIGFRIWA